jgi:hypothetical protein
VTFYQNFQPDFPKPYKILGDELGILWGQRLRERLCKYWQKLKPTRQTLS